MKYALLSALLAVGCTDDNQSLTIARFVELTGTGGSCLADPATTASVSSGLFDVKLGTTFGVGYLLGPVVRNNMLSIMTASSPEMNDVYINSFDIELKQDKGDSFLNGIAPANLKFNLPSAAGLVTPGGGQVATPIEVIPAGYVGMLQGVTQVPSVRPITVHLRSNGAHAGVTLSSSYSDFPVYLCDGCLLNRGNDFFTCPAKGIPTAQIQQGSCNFVQDADVTCCTSPTGLVCGPQVPVQTGM